MIFHIVGHSCIFLQTVSLDGLNRYDEKKTQSSYLKIIFKYSKITELSLNMARTPKFFTGKIVRQTFLKLLLTYWHFQFSKGKRFYIKRSSTNNVLLKGEEHYRSDFGVFKSITEKRKSCNSIAKRQFRLV